MGDGAMAGLAGRALKFLAAVAIALCLGVTIIPPFLDVRYYDGPVSGHYDGNHFFNPGVDDTLQPPTGKSRGGFLWRFLSGESGRQPWPDIVPVRPAKPEARVMGSRMVATWVGHASVLVQTQGVNILTDPVWSDRAGPFGFGPKRVTIPGIAFDDLPKIDVVLVSHNHYDHMDLDTIGRLWARDHPFIVTSLGNDALIARTGAPSIALDWGQGVNVRPGMRVIVTRNHHWSSRWFSDSRRALWSSFVIQVPGGNIYFAGDTGFGDGRWPQEARRFGPVRLALIPIGAFRFEPGMVRTASHIGPMEAERVFAQLKAGFAIPIHWGTFQLSNEARETPPKMLAEVVRCAGYADASRFAAHPVGTAVDVPALGKIPDQHAPNAECLARSDIYRLN